MQPVRDVVAEVAEHREGLCVHRPRRRDGQAQIARDGVEGARGGAVQIEDARHARPAIAGEQGLELLGELVVRIDGRHVQGWQRRLVEVDDGLGVAAAIGGDRLQGQHVVDPVFAGQGHALGDHLLLAGDAGVGVIFVGRGRIAAGGRVHLAVAVTGAGVVLDPVPGQTEEQAVVRRPFGAGAIGGDVLVVLVLAGVQVLAVAVVLIGGDRAADGEGITHRDRSGQQEVALIVRAHLGPRRQAGIVAQPLGDVFDRTADGVAAVEGALRPAKHLDPRDVEDVQHRALGTGHIDVVDIEADAGLEAPQRVLLAHAADEADQGRVGAAGDLHRGVRRLLLQGRDIGRAGLFQPLGAEGRDRDRHVLQLFVAPTGGDDDVLDHIGLPCIGRLGRRLGVLGRGSPRQHAPSRAGQQRALHMMSHDPTPLVVVSSPLTLLFSVQ